ncbi:hypothetical protein IV203_038304 [Nitzschia inconspicua]|uniref:Uncharacterized protein n=1 Tax=Nitzschia inconspicua TaxID=303405 RepID=A0A9K3LR66_9STRA|nr:hypothetical protein IV203_038304 [Nitzschia inconspicua]
MSQGYEADGNLMSREETLKRWLETKERGKKLSKNPLSFVTLTESKKGNITEQSHLNSNNKQSYEFRTMMKVPSKGNLFIGVDERSSTPKPFYERLFDKSTISSQLKTRVLLERKSFPDSHSRTPGNFPPEETSPQTKDLTKTCYNWKTEPKPRRPCSAMTISNQVSSSFSKPGRNSSINSKSPLPPQRCEVMILTGKELVLDTTHPPPTSPMEWSVPTELSELESDKTFEEKSTAISRTEIDVMLEVTHKLNNSGYPLPSKQDDASSDVFVPAKENSCLVDHFLNLSIESTSSRDSFVNLKRRGRRSRNKRPPLNNQTNASEEHKKNEASEKQPQFLTRRQNLRDGKQKKYLDLDKPQTSSICMKRANETICSRVHQNAQCPADTFSQMMESDDDYDAKAVGREFTPKKRRSQGRLSEICTLCGLDNAPDRAQNDHQQGLATIHREPVEEKESDTENLVRVCPDFAKFDGKTILDCIPEDNVHYHCTQTSETSKRLEGMQSQIRSLQIDKKKLQDRIFMSTKDYEKRVTPFRNIFEEKRILRAANSKLKQENESINQTLLSAVSSLQDQMSLALTTALQNKTELEEKLSLAESTIQKLLRTQTNGVYSEI